MRLASQRQTVCEVCASGVRGEANVREALFGVESEVICEAVRQFAERAIALRRQAEDVRGAFELRDFAYRGGRFFENDVRVRAAEAEAANARPARPTVALPVAPARRDLEWRAGGRKAWVEFADMQMWRNVFALKRECDFDETGDPRSGFKVADISFD